MTSYALFENDSDVVWMFVVFEDRGTYDRNADDPGDARAVRASTGRSWRTSPEWHDGVIETM